MDESACGKDVESLSASFAYTHITGNRRCWLSLHDSGRHHTVGTARMQLRLDSSGSLSLLQSISWSLSFSYYFFSSLSLCLRASFFFFLSFLVYIFSLFAYVKVLLIFAYRNKSRLTRYMAVFCSLVHGFHLRALSKKRNNLKKTNLNLLLFSMCMQL